MKSIQQLQTLSDEEAMTMGEALLALVKMRRSEALNIQADDAGAGSQLVRDVAAAGLELAAGLRRELLSGLSERSGAQRDGVAAQET